MKKITLRLVLLIVTVIAVASSLSSCLDFSASKSKEEIAESISASLREDKKNFDIVSKYYVYWGLPDFDAEKMTDTESIFKFNYNYEDGMPETLEHAAASARHFLDNYYDTTDLEDTTAVTHALISSYVDVLDDPYAVYRVPVENDDYTLNMSGKFGGIGVTIVYDDENETVTVESINIGSPAEAAGFAVGDVLYAVDGVKISEIGYRNAVYYIRGEIGTAVSVTVLRGGKEVTLTATRAIVDDISASYEILENNIGYIRVSSFKKNTYEQFVRCVDAVKAAGVKGVVFDMRNNPGGYLDTVCEMLSYLIPTGQVIVSYEYANGMYREDKSMDDYNPATKLTKDEVLGLPIVVICNEYTASAGEIFTAAVRDYRNAGLLSATIVGTVTYKKGIMQSTYNYGDGSSVTLTTAYYNPPSGVNYHGTGVSPDVEVENTQTEDLQYNQAIIELNKLINANNN